MNNEQGGQQERAIHIYRYDGKMFCGTQLIGFTFCKIASHSFSCVVYFFCTGTTLQ
jgi:hypothetical protein